MFRFIIFSRQFQIFSPRRSTLRCAYSTKNTEAHPLPKIPIDRLQFHFSSSSGPGGQNVNKVATKVELRFIPKDADWLPEEIKQRFIELNKHRINKDGEFILVSQRYRYQEMNKTDCIEKLKEAIKEACVIPKQRIPTKVPKYAVEKRLHEKKMRSQLKRQRSEKFDY